MEPVKKLDWDSNFFNYNVGKINCQIQNSEQFSLIEESIVKNNYNLSYYSSKTELHQAHYKTDLLDIKLVDKKTTYCKKVQPDYKIDDSIFVVKKLNQNDKLLQLAIESGVYSRFNIDDKIGKDKFEEMYSLWMINSVQKKLAFEVLGYKDHEHTVGFVTIGEKNNRADIGIIAVDSNYRGKGIGKKIMRSAEKWVANLGYEYIQVVTQGDNFPACKLYESCGYNIESIEYFYHFWKKDKAQQSAQ